MASLVLFAFVTISRPVNAEDNEQFALEFLGSTPHSREHFTQGLFFDGGALYESIGQYGESALIKYAPDLQSPSVRRRLEDQYFAEGATSHQGVIYQLTWQAGKSYAYRGAMLSPSEGFRYSGEGWGLTSDGTHLWLSDGSDKLQVMDSDGNIQSRLSVQYKSSPLNRLNELEWINGWILANRWYDHQIYVIDPITGDVAHAFDLSDLALKELREDRNRVLNGIAWNPDTEELWITGKYWAQFYQFKLQLPKPKSID